MENRVFESIDKEIAKGENTFYGDYIHDWYLYDLYRGVCEIADVLKYSFFEKGMIDYFFYCKNDVFSAYEYVNGEIRECSDKIFEGKKAATSITKSKKLSLNNVNNDAVKSTGIKWYCFSLKITNGLRECIDHLMILNWNILKRQKNYRHLKMHM